MNWLKRLEVFYKKSRRAIVYVDLVFILVVFYMSNYFGGIWNQLLPAAIIGAFAILIEALFSMNDELQRHTDVQEYRNVNEVMAKIQEVVQEERRRKHEVSIIGSSGGTTINMLIQQILDKAQTPFEVTLLVVDPNSSHAGYFPEHWRSEAQATINRVLSVNATKPKNLVLKCYTYDYMPCLAGVLIDNKYLFLSSYTWSESAKLSAQYNPHIYYYRNPRHEFQFRIFETWLNHAPKKPI
jgi:hypothetical protein